MAESNRSTLDEHDDAGEDTAQVDSAPAHNNERCAIALGAVNRISNLFDALHDVTVKGWSDGQQSETLMAIVLRGRQLAEAASTMLGDDLESVPAQRAIVEYASDDPRYQLCEVES